MDAHAHLTGLGWRGSGYSLDSSDRGLKRPLLISHKSDDRGLGAKAKHEKQADQWWLNAFDSALQDLGSGKVSVLDQIKTHGIKRGSLYSFFRRGDPLEGTFTEPDSTPTSTSASTPTPAEQPAMAMEKTKSGSKRKLRESDEAPAVKKSKTESVAPSTNGNVNLAVESINGHGLKIVDGIIIPPPDDLNKKKEKKEPARKKRMREEHEKQHQLRLEALKAKAQAMKDPNYDWEKEERGRIEARINREVKAEILKRELAEEFGPILPSPADLLKMEKEADKLGPERFPETALAALSIKVHGVCTALPREPTLTPIAAKRRCLQKGQIQG
jgi:hypothetical protein